MSLHRIFFEAEEEAQREELKREEEAEEDIWSEE